MSLGYFSDFLGEKSGMSDHGEDMKLNDRIEITPGTCSGRPHIAKTRIRAQNIVLWTEMGKCPDEIVAEYPQLQLADVYAALLFYFENREEMDRQIREDEHFVELLQSRASSSAL